MYRIGFIILALAAIALGLVVGTLNSEAVNVDLLWIQIQWPLGLVMLLALVVGFAVGIAMTWLTTVLPARMKLKKLKGNPGRLPSGGNDA